MKYLLLLICIPAYADLYVGGSQGTFVVEKDQYSLVVLDRPLLMAQHRIGGPVYLKGGIGLSRATRKYTALNFCITVGYHPFPRVRLDITHCSNADLREPNKGMDFIALKYRF